MTGPGERPEADSALWRRWRNDARPARDEAPDPMLLAAYAEGRLDEAEAEPVEDWLFQHPEALEDILAARRAEAEAVPPSPDAAVLRAAALVPAGGGSGPAKVVPFPLQVARRRALQRVAAWGGLAASLLITSLVGFGLGNNAYDSLSGQPASVESIGHELLDPPSAVFGEDEEPDT